MASMEIRFIAHPQSQRAEVTAHFQIKYFAGDDGWLAAEFDS
jgi:hypothetical protein